MSERQPLDRSIVGGPIQIFYQKAGEPRRPAIARGEGIYLWDTTGRRYIDASSGPIAVNLGYGNEKVINAIREQSAQITYASRAFFENEANEELASLITECAGAGLERAFFTSGGSESTETALKLARHSAVVRGQSSRWKVISRDPSYHGSTLGAVSVTGDFKSLALFGPMIRSMPKISAPFSYRLPPEETVHSYALKCADELERTIEAEGSDTVLAFIMEPVGGLATGALVSTEAYCQRVREICSRHGVLLIHDEVMSGVGRSGAFLTSHLYAHARPDIVTLAKGLASGYSPLGAVLASREMVDCVADAGGFMHGFTYSSNPLSCAVGVATVRETLALDLASNAQAMGARLRERLSGIAQRHWCIGDVRGKGLLQALEIVSDPEKKTTFPGDAQAIARLVAMAMKRGLMIYSRRTADGKYGEWLMIAPPLIVTAEQVDEIAGLIEATIQEFETDQ